MRALIAHFERTIDCRFTPAHGRSQRRVLGTPQVLGPVPPPSAPLRDTHRHPLPGGGLSHTGQPFQIPPGRRRNLRPSPQLAHATL